MHSLSGRVCLKENGAKVEHLGLLHSHPSRSNPANDNDEFSWGDGLVAAVSGKIYLTTPHGEIYALNRKQAWDLILPSAKREAFVWMYNNIPEIVNKYSSDIGERLTENPEKFEAWLIKQAAKALSGLEVYKKDVVDPYILYNLAAFDETTRGSNFENFESNSYNTNRQIPLGG